MTHLPPSTDELTGPPRNAHEAERTGHDKVSNTADKQAWEIIR